MARNRIIYNVEGLYVSPYSGEQNVYSDYYLNGYQILKRLEKIQNFNYSIQKNELNAQGFGQKKNIFKGQGLSPEVSFNFSYIPDGVTNENRLNFDVATFDSTSQPAMFSSLCSNNSLYNDRDFYLVVNKNDDDLFGNYEMDDYSVNPTGLIDVLDSNSKNYGLLHFQNSYLNEYSFNVSLGNLPEVKQSYVADNIMYYLSGSEVSYSILDLKSGINQIQSDKILVPKALNYNQSSISGQNILLPGDASVTFYRNPSHDSTNIISLIPENVTLPGTNMTVVGNTFTCLFTSLDGTNWSSQAYSSIGYRNNMFVEATSNAGLLKNVVFGLSSNPTLNTFMSNVDYAFYFNDNGNFYIMENNGGTMGHYAIYGTFTTSTKARIEYDGKTVTYFKDGVVLRSVNVPIQNQTYYFDSSFYNAGASINANYGTLSNIQYYNDTIQSLDYSLSFNRKAYRAINYKFPLLRKIEFPINGKLNTSFIVKEDFQGSFFDTLNRDDDYNIVANFASNKPGVYPTQFIFSGCKFNNINYDSSIGSNKTATLSFNFDLDPDFGTRGIFAKGNVLYASRTGLLEATSQGLVSGLLGTESSIEYDLTWKDTYILQN